MGYLLALFGHHFTEETAMTDADKEWVKSHVDKLKQRAAMARSWAVSHRDFNVGCAIGVKARYGRQRPSYHISMGANCKPLPHNHGPKTCAEAHALHDIGDIAYAVEILCIVVYGVPQKDHESSIAPKTLHSCGDCRRLFQNHRLVTDETMMVFVNAEDPRVVEEMKFADLIALHNGNK